MEAVTALGGGGGLEHVNNHNMTKLSEFSLMSQTKSGLRDLIGNRTCKQ